MLLKEPLGAGPHEPALEVSISIHRGLGLTRRIGQGQGFCSQARRAPLLLGNCYLEAAYWVLGYYSMATQPISVSKMENVLVRG